MDWLKSEVDQDMIIENNGTPDKVNICAGMIFLNNTLNTLRVWRHVTDEYETARDDTSRLAETEQTILSRVVKKKKIFDKQINIAWKYFPLDHVFSGKWYKHPDIRWGTFEKLIQLISKNHQKAWSLVYTLQLDGWKQEENKKNASMES